MPSGIDALSRRLFGAHKAGKVSPERDEKELLGRISGAGRAGDSFGDRCPRSLAPRIVVRCIKMAVALSSLLCFRPKYLIRLAPGPQTRSTTARAGSFLVLLSHPGRGQAGDKVEVWGEVDGLSVSFSVRPRVQVQLMFLIKCASLNPWPPILIKIAFGGTSNQSVKYG